MIAGSREHLRAIRAQARAAEEQARVYRCFAFRNEPRNGGRVPGAALVHRDALDVASAYHLLASALTRLTVVLERRETGQDTTYAGTIPEAEDGQ